MFTFEKQSMLYDYWWSSGMLQKRSMNSHITTHLMFRLKTVLPLEEPFFLTDLLLRSSSLASNNVLFPNIPQEYSVLKHRSMNVKYFHRRSSHLTYLDRKCFSNIHPFPSSHENKVFLYLKKYVINLLLHMYGKGKVLGGNIPSIHHSDLNAKLITLRRILSKTLVLSFPSLWHEYRNREKGDGNDPAKHSSNQWRNYANQIS